MTISTAALGTRLRTWALVAGLTGLLIACGALIGGSLLWIFVIAAVAMNVVGYFFSDRIALRASRARPLEPTRRPSCTRSSGARVAGRGAGAEPPPDPRRPGRTRSPPAATPRTRRSRSPRACCRRARRPGARRCSRTSSRTSATTTSSSPRSRRWSRGAISAIASILQLSFLFGSSDEEGENPIAALALMLIAPIGGDAAAARGLAPARVPRRRDRGADARHRPPARRGAAHDHRR